MREREREPAVVGVVKDQCSLVVLWLPLSHCACHTHQLRHHNITRLLFMIPAVSLGRFLHRHTQVSGLTDESAFLIRVAYIVVFTTSPPYRCYAIGFIWDSRSSRSWSCLGVFWEVKSPVGRPVAGRRCPVLPGVCVA